MDDSDTPLINNCCYCFKIKSTSSVENKISTSENVMLESLVTFVFYLLNL